MRTHTEITFLGTSSCLYDLGNDTASYLVNGNGGLLIDTGWNAVDNLRRAGFDPGAIGTVLFTHMHHDHYLALTSLLFYRISCGKSLDSLTLIGPKDLKNVTSSALVYLQIERFFSDSIGTPVCVELDPRASFTLESSGFQIDAIPSVHTVDGRYYMIRDPETGRIIGFSGDTVYDESEGEFFSDCDMLIHECSLGANRSGNNEYQHSSAYDAGRAAEQARAKQLVLVHYPEKITDDCVRAASTVYGGIIKVPSPGETVWL